ncbi:MAG: aldo/keto reductase [Rhodoluna sp.]
MTFDPKNMPLIELNNGQLIPQLGLGVYKLEPFEAADLVSAALETGYRRVDTAAIYGNEVEVGEGIRQSSVPREEIYVTTKIWNDRHGYATTLEAVDESLARLNIDYIDMLLIHWPAPSQDKFVDTWAAFDEVAKSGKVRGIGVSNFHPMHLHKLLAAGGTTPALNQVELHPALQQPELRAYNSSHAIATEAWSPLARGRFHNEALIVKIAEKHGKTPTQIILRWHIELGNLVIPKTATPARLLENISVFDFNLDENDLAAIATLDSGFRTGPNPEEFI